MKPLIIDDKAIKLIAQFGIAEAAHKLGRRYGTVRDAAIAAGLNIKRGRPREKQIIKRNERIKALRKGKLLLREIGAKYNIGRERVRQILAEKSQQDPVTKAWREAALLPPGVVLRPTVTKDAPELAQPRGPKLSPDKDKVRTT